MQKVSLVICEYDSPSLPPPILRLRFYSGGAGRGEGYELLPVHCGYFGVILNRGTFDPVSLV